MYRQMHIQDPRSARDPLSAGGLHRGPLPGAAQRWHSGAGFCAAKRLSVRAGADGHACDLPELPHHLARFAAIVAPPPPRRFAYAMESHGVRARRLAPIPTPQQLAPPPPLSRGVQQFLTDVVPYLAIAVVYAATSYVRWKKVRADTSRGHGRTQLTSSSLCTHRAMQRTARSCGARQLRTPRQRHTRTRPARCCSRWRAWCAW